MFQDEEQHVTEQAQPSPGEPILRLGTENARKTLTRMNPNTAAGPDNIPGCLLKGCSDQLYDVLRDIFNISLSQATVQAYFQDSVLTSGFHLVSVQQQRD